MKLKALIVLAVLIVLSGCGLISQEPELSPQEVVTKFYRWYLGYPGNPLVDREYRESPYLAESYIEKVEEALEGGFMADPILLAQDIPERFTVDETEMGSDEAMVTVSFYWGGNPTPSRRDVELRLIGGEWKITGVSMLES